ncbi:MAG: TonB-dependent receptor plug domain-containing protein [Terriglobales bacterium]
MDTRFRRFSTHAARASVLFCASLSLSLNSLAETTQPPQSGNPVKQLSLEQLGSIEVTTASKEPEEVWKTPAAVYVITHDDIERSGATSIPEALRLAPGIEVARIDSNKWSIGIRGFGSRLSRSVLVLIDGRTVYTTLLAGTYWEVQDTVLEDVDRIEVIRGPGGTIWGPNAVNGVINIITKLSKDTHGTLLSVGGGNEEQGFLNARYGGGNGRNLDYRVYVKGFNRGPEFHPDGRDFDRWRAAQSGFRVDWTRNDRDTFNLQGDIYDEGAGESVVGTSYTPPYSQVLDDTALLSGANISGRWKRTFSQNNDIQLQAYYDRTNRHEPNFGDIRDTFDVDFLQRFQPAARHQFSWGLGARFSRGNDIQVVSGLTFLPAKRTDQLFTAFFQDEISLVNDRLMLSVGTKLLKTNFTGAQLEPSGRLLWTPTATQSVWLAFTHAVRTPSDAERDFFLSGFIDIAPNGLPFFARFNANRNFRSEQLNGYELGYRRLIGKKFYIDLAGFYNHYSDLFSEDITGAPFIETDPQPTHILLPAQFGNGLLGTTSGGEVAPEWKPTRWWRLRGSYSYLQVELKKAPNSQDVGTIPGIEGSSPQHQVSVQSGFDLSRTVTLDVDYRYISALPGQLVPSYSTADARVAWRMSEHFQASIAGRNLLQPHHPEFAGDPGPLVEIKRSVYGQITWKR